MADPLASTVSTPDADALRVGDVLPRPAELPTHRHGRQALRQHTLILLNPHAAGGRARKLQAQIEASLLLADPRPLFFMTEDLRSARRIVDALPSGTRIVIAGGDGSVQPMLPSLVTGGHTLAVVPIGSGNDTARALGVQRSNWRKALELALTGESSSMDLGEISYRLDSRGSEQRSLFISSLAAGFDAAVTARAAAGPRWLRGLPRYLLATLGELAALRRFDVKLRADGVSVRDGDVLLASSLNTATYGAGMPIAPVANDNDGQLDLMLAEGMGIMRVLRLLPAMLVGRHLDRPGVRHLRFAELEAKAGTPLPVAADGEFLGNARQWQIRVRPGLLSVVRQPPAI